MPPAPELKATLTLPQTAFPMKANLPQNEPLRLERWAQMGLYAELRKASHGRPAYLLHDGPPYANGPIHLGHALNKGLKDFVVKSKTMAGFDAPYVPGYDCHGLPIEIKVDEKLGHKKLEMPAPAVLDACRAYAQKYIDLQASQFERIGCFGRWAEPYKTMSRAYEARTLEAFYGFLEKDFVYRGLKPVYWCIHDRTALAEAEVEYAPHTSPSVYVRYKMTSYPNNVAPGLTSESEEGWAVAEKLGIDHGNIQTIIWTTTPWTLPASLAVAFNPELEYTAVEAISKGIDKTPQIYIVAASLLAEVAEKCNFRNPDFPGENITGWKQFRGESGLEDLTIPGASLEGARFQHPFLERSILGVLATYVTADTGTGAVHTAPAHGADDFYTGQRYGLDPICRVDAAGYIHVDSAAWPHDAPPAFDDKKVWEANPIIVAMLEERGALLGGAPLEHSYPHCWRCHHPVIFRATEQWFIGLETPVTRADGSETTYRQLSIEEIDKVVWDPAWGKERITNMIATRPDWCISRQRIWGVPIAVFLCEGCNKPIIDAALNRKIVDLFEREGIEAWHSTSVPLLLPQGSQCKHCGGTGFRKEKDILDVWFDSGVSWMAVCESDPDLSAIYTAFQSDKGTKVLYLEGGDQHRGWFHSSLLTSVALRGRAPYSHVATAGWTLDEQGRAMSKSLGNGVDPVDIANRMGGEIVRLWVASVDFREDMAASENLMQRCAELYKKLRNTFRFLLGNLNGFEPGRDHVPEPELLPLDRYMLARTRELTEKILAWYEAFEFHRVYQAVNEFAIVDLSSFYLDVLKDRMYTFAPTSHERRSAQTVLWQITETLVRLVAPILTFTADEIWEHLPSVTDRPASVHLALFPEPAEVFSQNPAPVIEHWEDSFQIRDEAMRLLEEKRKAGEIGKAIEAELVISAWGRHVDVLKTLSNDDLKEFFNVSKVRLNDVSETRFFQEPLDTESPIPLRDYDRSGQFRVKVNPASGSKCARCWNFMPDTADYGIWHDVCGRCRAALKEMGIAEPKDEAAS